MAADRRTYRVTGDAELFLQPGGWYYLRVPRWISDELSHLAERGLIPVKATVGSTTWDTSLLPKGDGSHFIALNAKVRRAYEIEAGDRITVIFQTRLRVRG